MRRTLLLARLFEDQQFAVNHIFELSQQNSHKIVNVLRLGVSSEICLFNNTNYQFKANITQIKSKVVIVKIIDSTHVNLESPLKIHLAQGIATKEKMDFIIQKATELGVFEITPIITQKSKVKLKTQQDQKQKKDRWQAVAIAACCQCGRNTLPIINHTVNFDEFIFKYSEPQVSAFDSSNAKSKYKFILSPNLCSDLNKANISSKILDLDINQEIILMIGAESGFSNQEISMAIKQKFLLLNLGPRVLRTETAPIAAISIFQGKYGDLFFE